MGSIDVILGIYNRAPERLADLFNGVMFAGQQVIDAKYLRSLPRKKALLLWESKVSDLTPQKIKYKENGKIAYMEREPDCISLHELPDAECFLACEAQSKTDYNMPARNHVYDSVEISEQLAGKRKILQIADGISRPLLPLYRLTLYTGEKRWNSKKNLREMIRVGTKLRAFSEQLWDYPCFVADIRMKRGVTQEALAARLNVVRQTVSKWEKGVSVPDAVTLQKIAEVLDVDVSCFLGNEPSKEDSENEPAGRHGEMNELPAVGNRMSGRTWKVIIAAAAVCVLLVTVFALCTPRNAGSVTLVPAKPITEARAKELALQDLGFPEADVVFDRIVYVESEDKGNYYEIFFTYEKEKYLYQVFDGEVCSGGPVGGPKN